MTKEHYVTICPKCHSSDVSMEKNPVYAITGLLIHFKQCNNCGHHGQVFPEVPASEVPKKPKNIKKIKERQFVQTSYGKGYYKFILLLAALWILFIVFYIFR